MVAAVRIYQAGAVGPSIPVVGVGGHNTPLHVDLSAYSNVTRIGVADITLEPSPAACVCVACHDLRWSSRDPSPVWTTCGPTLPRYGPEMKIKTSIQAGKVHVYTGTKP